MARVLALGAAVFFFVFAVQTGTQTQRAVSSTDLVKVGCDLAREAALAEVRRLETAVERDIQAIRNLSPSFETNEEVIQEWLGLSATARADLHKESLELLADLAVEDLKQLVRGVGATAQIYPVQAFDFIRDQNISNPVLVDWIQRWALFNLSNPTWSADAGDLLIDGLKGVNDINKAKDWSDYVAVVTNVAPLMFKRTFRNRHPALKQAGLLLAEGEFALAAIMKNLTLRLNQAWLEAFTSLTEIQLKSLANLSSQLEERVQALTAARASVAVMEACATALNWQENLQRQRLDAIKARNMVRYNALIKQHASVYRQAGVEPCHSGFFPSGCRAPATAAPALSAVNSCLPTLAANATEALQIEAGSAHNVCWTRGQDGRLNAISKLPPNLSYKSAPPIGVATVNATKPSANESIAGSSGSVRTVDDRLFIDLDDPRTIGQVYDFPGNGQTGIRIISWYLRKRPPQPGPFGTTDGGFDKSPTHLVYGPRGNINCFSNGTSRGAFVVPFGEAKARGGGVLTASRNPTGEARMLDCMYTDSPTGIFQVGICPKDAYYHTNPDTGNADGCAKDFNDILLPPTMYTVPVKSGRISMVVVATP